MTTFIPGDADLKPQCQNSENPIQSSKTAVDELPVKQNTIITSSPIRANVPKATKFRLCIFCDQHFRSRYNIEHHTCTYTSEKQFICYECGKEFNFKIQYRTSYMHLY